MASRIPRKKMSVHAPNTLYIFEWRGCGCGRFKKRAEISSGTHVPCSACRRRAGRAAATAPAAWSRCGTTRWTCRACWALRHDTTRHDTTPRHTHNTSTYNPTTAVASERNTTLSAHAIQKLKRNIQHIPDGKVCTWFVLSFGCPHSTLTRYNEKEQTIWTKYMMKTAEHHYTYDMHHIKI